MSVVNVGAAHVGSNCASLHDAAMMLLLVMGDHCTGRRVNSNDGIACGF